MIRSRGRCAGNGRRAGIRRSKLRTAIFASAAANSASVSAAEASSCKSASFNSSCSRIAPRSEDCPNRSCRSLAIVYLSFSISNVRCLASLSSALARACAAASAARVSRITACAPARSVGSEPVAGSIRRHDSQIESLMSR